MAGLRDADAGARQVGFEDGRRGVSRSVGHRPGIQHQGSAATRKSRAVAAPRSARFPREQLSVQVSNAFVFIVHSSQYRNIWNPNPLLTVTDRDERASADSTSRSVTGNGADHEVGWKELAASRGRHSCRVSPRLPLAGVAGLFAALPLRWRYADRRIVLLTACQLVWEAL